GPRELPIPPVEIFPRAYVLPRAEGGASCRIGAGRSGEAPTGALVQVVCPLQGARTDLHRAPVTPEGALSAGSIGNRRRSQDDAVEKEGKQSVRRCRSSQQEGRLTARTTVVDRVLSCAQFGNQ